ncbi:hypothetical protein [Streptomyces niveus]|uniref:hypothetical protein n=1 Tax=Streptomyces niveus TaxID=193462 RepID=UPI00378C76C4
MLAHLLVSHSAPSTRDAPVEALPPHLRRSLTWDQGSEMVANQAFTVATDIPVHFRNPASP